MKRTKLDILVVDDDEIDLELIVEAFQRAGASQPIGRIRSGNEAIRYLRGDGDYADRARYPYPSFIFCDLKMPNGDGFDVLEYLKSTPEFTIIPTVMWSNSCDCDDVKRAYILGASSYFCKPQDFGDMCALIRRILDYWAACEIPEIDVTGRLVDTESHGRIGERYLLGRH